MSFINKILTPFLQLILWFHKKRNWSNIIFILILLLMLFSRAAFHSNYDNYTSIQSIPDFIEQKKEGKERNALKLSTLHDYLKKYTTKTRAIARPVLNPDNYMAGNELNRNRFLWFVCFLITDLFFALFLGIFLMRSIIPKLFKHSDVKDTLTKSGSWFFFIFGLTILSDLGENILMLSGIPSFRVYGILHASKTIIFGIFLFQWFFHYHSLNFKENANHILKSVSASSVSLVVIILVLSLLTMMQQGITLVLDLFTDPFNSILFIIFLAFASILLSHFPTYLYIRFYKSGDYQWIWSSRFWIPTIYYTEGKTSALPDEEFNSLTSDEKKASLEKVIKERKTASIFRHFLGTFFLMMMLYAFVYSWNRTSFKIPSAIINQFFIILGFILLFLHIKLYERKDQIKKAFKSKTDLNKALLGDPKLLDKYKGPMRVFLMLLILSLFLLVGRIFFDEWSMINKIYTVIQLMILIVLYIIFREYRSLLKYRFGLSPMFSSKEASWDFSKGAPYTDPNPLIASSIQEDERIKEWPKNIHLLGNYSNTVYYLYAIALVGILIPLIMIFISFTPYLSVFNGANYLLLFILLIYAIFIAIVKATFYGENHMKKNLFIPRKNKEPLVELELKKNKSFLWIPLNYLGFLSIIFVLILVFLFNSGSDHHLLGKIKVSENKILNEDTERLSIDQNTFKNKFSEKSNGENVFAISAFGGGLKANYNTLKTLDTIQKATNQKFLQNTISMSGVSGGGLGLANYYLLNFYNQDSQKDKEDKIRKIGETDIVAIDLAYVLFHDLLRNISLAFVELFNPEKDIRLGKDRSKVAMEKYRKILVPGESLEIPFQRIHTKIYERGNHAPALLMNTTSTKLEYGLGSSIDLGEMAGAINILKGPTIDSFTYNTLSYYDAVSTVNRFPYLSPAAKIKNLGHFVDGGYFENSGILTTISFLDQISGSKWGPNAKLEINGDQKKVVIVNFLNSKAHWINHLIREKKILNDRLRIRENESSETGAVIGTMTGTEMLPNYFVEALENKSNALDSTFEFIAFHIPYKIYMDDIIKFLDAEPLQLDTIQQMILQNNTTIDSLLMNSKEDFGYDFREWGAVEPALARKLSTPDRLYQDIMIAKHPFVKKQIDRIRELCGGGL